MYYLHEGSSKTDEPLFIKLPTKPIDLNSPIPMFYPDLVVGQQVYSDGIPERILTTWVHDTLIQPDKTFIDIGAHVGTYSWICGRKATHTYSFECNPEIFCYLAANIALHGMTDRITPYSFALGNREDAVDYYMRGVDGGHNGVKMFGSVDAGRKSIKVPMKTLDSLRLENIGLIKIDVEGFEKEVLEGAQDTLKRNNYPKILFESWRPEWRDPEGIEATRLRSELFGYVNRLGYTIVSIIDFPEMFFAEVRN